MYPKTGFQSRGSRFGMGIGVLNVSRGYGPVTFEVIGPFVPAVARIGGPSAKAVVTKRFRPKLVSIKREEKKRKKYKAKKKAA